MYNVYVKKKWLLRNKAAKLSADHVNLIITRQNWGMRIADIERYDITI